MVILFSHEFFFFSLIFIIVDTQQSIKKQKIVKSFIGSHIIDDFFFPKVVTRNGTHLSVIFRLFPMLHLCHFILLFIVSNGMCNVIKCVGIREKVFK